MQALHIGLKVIRVELECAEAKGLLFVFPDSGEPSGWRRFWFDDDGPGAG